VGSIPASRTIYDEGPDREVWPFFLPVFQSGVTVIQPRAVTGADNGESMQKTSAALLSVQSMGCAGDHRLFYLGWHWHWRLGFRLMECRRTRPRGRAFEGDEYRDEQKKKNDQEIDFLCTMAFHSPIRVEIVFIQTHDFSTTETCCFTWPGILSFGSKFPGH
jgi:hypothetical protein